MRAKRSKIPGIRKHPLYRVYWGIRTRCSNPKTIGWKNWGGRGIKCEWETFGEFVNDMFDSYKERTHGGRTYIDRIDNSGNYCKENCRWVDMKTQQRNKRNNHILEFRGETHNVSDWADMLGVDRLLIFNRLRRGWTAEEALTTPLYTRLH